MPLLFGALGGLYTVVFRQELYVATHPVDSDRLIPKLLQGTRFQTGYDSEINAVELAKSIISNREFVSSVLENAGPIPNSSISNSIGNFAKRMDWGLNPNDLEGAASFDDASDTSSYARIHRLDDSNEYEIQTFSITEEHALLLNRELSKQLGEKIVAEVDGFLAGKLEEERFARQALLEQLLTLLPVYAELEESISNWKKQDTSSESEQIDASQRESLLQLAQVVEEKRQIAQLLDFLQPDSVRQHEPIPAPELFGTESLGRGSLGQEIYSIWESVSQTQQSVSLLLRKREENYLKYTDAHPVAQLTNLELEQLQSNLVSAKESFGARLRGELEKLENRIRQLEANRVLESSNKGTENQFHSDMHRFISTSLTAGVFSYPFFIAPMLKDAIPADVEEAKLQRSELIVSNLQSASLVKRIQEADSRIHDVTKLKSDLHEKLFVDKWEREKASVRSANASHLAFAFFSCCAGFIVGLGLSVVRRCIKALDELTAIRELIGDATIGLDLRARESQPSVSSGKLEPTQSQAYSDPVMRNATPAEERGESKTLKLTSTEVDMAFLELERLSKMQPCNAQEEEELLRKIRELKEVLALSVRDIRQVAPNRQTWTKPRKTSSGSTSKYSN